jgi:hypothetical protein
MIAPVGVVDDVDEFCDAVSVNTSELNIGKFSIGAGYVVIFI